MDANIKGYSQWFPGKSNNVVDALLRDWHLGDNELTSLLLLQFPEQMPKIFQILPLPSKIGSWLTSLLPPLLVSEQLWEQHTTTGIELGINGPSGASPLDATTSTLTNSDKSNKIFYLVHLPWLSEKEGSRKIALNHWLKEQSTVPSHMWYRPFRNLEDRIPLKTQTTCLASFYQGSSEPIAMTTPKKFNKRPFPFASSMN
jgi:hypothetical protein